MRSLVQDLYEPGLAPSRARFAASPALTTLFAEGADAANEIAPELLELFFIHYNALGVQMTEPVEGWIRRAGERCEAIGLANVGRALKMHARHEANHHLMMIADTKKLVARRNARTGEQLSAEHLIATPATNGIRLYVALHEAVIAGETPFAQVAIELEIERLSVTYGGKVLARCAAVLGKTALDGMSFLEEHVAIDAGHTNFNENELDKLLRESPGRAPVLIAAGGAALAAYASFMSDCLDMAKACMVRDTRRADVGGTA